MKKFSLLMMISLTLAITSCNKQSATEEPIGDSVTFNLSTEYEVEVKSGASRSSELTRYIVEIYEGSDLTEEPVYKDNLVSSTFTVRLDANKTYICLFWADNGTAGDNENGTFNASSLQDVRLNTGEEMTEAFYSRYNMEALGKNAHEVELKRSMAQVNLISTVEVSASSRIVATHNAYTQFNVSSGEVLGNRVSVDKPFDITADNDTLGSFLTFASVAGVKSDFGFVLGGAVNSSVADVTLKANYITNIKGKFSFQDNTFSFDVRYAWDGEIDVPLTPADTVMGYYETADYKGYGVKIDGLWWAPVNVGYTDSTRYGLLYNWGENKGFGYGTAGQSSTTGSWKVQEQGPCPEGWRIPTDAEFTNLLTAVNGGTGQWRDASASNPEGHAGRWFGPNCKDATLATPGNAVFFPAAGYWDSSFSNRGARGYYWSSASGRRMDFRSGYARMTSNGVSFGFSLRCVQN